MIYLSETIGKPLYEQLYEILKNRILNGSMRRDQALRPIRALAGELNISNNTVSRAYQMLMSEGLIRGVSGSGYYVEDISGLLHIGAPLKPNGPGGGDGSEPASAVIYDFQFESIDSNLFPWNKWHQYMHDALSAESHKKAISYESNKGNAALRASLCDYLNGSRGINCDPEQVIICAGTQYGLDIITNIMKISFVAFEEPGYNAVKNIFIHKGCRVIPIPLRHNGIDFGVLENFRGSRAMDVLYITPSHQFPTGITTPMAERVALLQLALKNNMYIIENDYDNEFSYGNKRLPALRSLSADRVIYISTLSKVLSPSLRCAYFVLPTQLVPVYDRVYRYYNSALPACNQKALSNFINDGNLDKHARKMSAINKKKFEVFSRSLKDLMGDRVEISNPAGSHVLVQINGCRDHTELTAQLRQRGIGIYGIREHWCIKEQVPENVFLFGYNSMSEEKIPEACQALAAALNDLIY